MFAFSCGWPTVRLPPTVFIFKSVIAGDDQQYKILLDLEAEDKGHRN